MTAFVSPAWDNDVYKYLASIYIIYTPFSSGVVMEASMAPGLGSFLHKELACSQVSPSVPVNPMSL